MLRSHGLFESSISVKTLLKSVERSETLNKSCKQMKQKRFTVAKIVKKKSTVFFSFIFKYEKTQHVCSFVWVVSMKLVEFCSPT